MSSIQLTSLLLLVLNGPLCAQAVTEPRAGARGDEVLARYQRLLQEPEAARVALASELAAVQGSRAAALIETELAGARDKRLVLALLKGLAEHPRRELATAVAGALRVSAPDPDVATAVGKALAAMDEAGVPALVDLIEAFATGRSNHRDRPRAQAAMIDALGASSSPKARAAAAALAGKGNPVDRLRVLGTLAKAGGEHGVEQARRSALSAPYAPLVLEGLKQIGVHHARDFTASALTVFGRATGALEGPLLTGLAPIVADHLGPELYEVFFAAAAACDPTLSRGLRRHAAKLRADPGLGAFVLGRASRLATPQELTLAAQLVPAVPGAEATEFLADLTLAKEPVVAETAVAALGERRDASAVPALRRLLRSPGGERRRAAFASLHAIVKAEADWLAEVRAATTDRDLRVLAIDLLAELGDEAFLPAAQALFPDPDWRVRAAAYDFCRRVRSVSTIPLLLDRLGVERGRMLQDVVDALVALTGQDLRSERQWRDFWADHAAGFQLAKVAASAARKRTRSDDASTTRTYYSLPVVSTAVMFVVDHSGSMAAPVGTGGTTRLEEAKRQLVRVLGSTPDGYRVGVVTFDTNVQTLQDRLVELNERTRSDLVGRVQALRIGSATNVHDGLAAAFADPDVDTIYLLTDGAPSTGPIVEPAALRAAVARWNRTRRIRIHTIAIGAASNLMSWLAADSGGHTVTVR